MRKRDELKWRAAKNDESSCVGCVYCNTIITNKNDPRVKAYIYRCAIIGPTGRQMTCNNISTQS
jgi:hypothetical protein